MRGVLAAVIVGLALIAPSGALASESDPAPVTARALTKDQRITLSALSAHNRAINRYTGFVSTRPAAIQTIKNRFQCVIDRLGPTGTYISNFNSLPENVRVQVFIPIQASYLFGTMFKFMPPKRGKFSAQATKSIYLAAARRARKLDPGITGERVIRGLRAQADRIDLYRSLPTVRACTVLDDWATNGFDLDLLDPLTDQSAVIALKFEASNTDPRIDAAIAAMKTVPGIDAAEAQEFDRALIDRAYLTILQPLAP